MREHGEQNNLKDIFSHKNILIPLLLLEFEQDVKSFYKTF